MTDQELRDLLHERVADVTGRDLSDAAWGRATRIRRRRTAGVVAGAVAAVAVVAVAVSGGPGADRSTGPGPATQRPSPTASVPAWPDGPAGTKPDGHYRGWPVYWGPLVSQEETLPRVDSPFPEEVDLSAPAPDLADEPITSALAAYALLDDDGGTRLLLLAPDGSLRSVDTSRVAPYDDGAGEDISVGHDSLLSPTGEYLAFPQAGHVLVLTLATGEWRSVDTGTAPTTTLHWMGDTDLWLPPTTQGGAGPMFSALDGRRSGATSIAAPAGPFVGEAGAYGRWRMGPGGIAQSWGRIEGLPVPRNEITPSQALLVQGDAPARNAMLVLSAASLSGDHPRPDHCCSVEFWLDVETVVYESPAQPRRLVAWRVGTHDMGLVTSIVGFDPDREVLVSSYARIWDR
ncbi:hypothetical protein ACT8ZV_21730 [Nocardioides sp. MAHUQ-72]|uniref:hypothetical protein n=1 Tax=unclassified Nocardioides TaxID=2615069 RepID=UPI003620A079